MHAAIRLVAVLPLATSLAACTYLEQARQVTDASAATINQTVLDTLVQADIERQRLRSLRCLDPLLTPLAIKTAAADSRLGQRWLDELVHDCPELATTKSTAG